MSDADTTVDWRASVSIRPDEDLRAEIDHRRDAARPRRSIWVTDLLDLRTAYYTRVAPQPTPPERRARLGMGQTLHAAIGSRLAPARNLEVRVQREGIVGQIDLLEDFPTELKSTSALPDPTSLAESRPQYIEQLAMYCALVDRPTGRLLIVQVTDDRPGPVAIFDLAFRELPAVFDEMLRRADRLRSAWERRSPEGLPACEWRGRGCPFQTADVCACTGAEARPSRSLLEAVERLEFLPVESRELTDELVRSPPAPPIARKFRDLLYPRRAYFERLTPPGAAAAGETVGPPVADDLYRQVSDLLEGGAPGEVTRAPPTEGGPAESVACFRGDPYLLKVSRAWRRATPTELLDHQPQYFLDLGLRCAAVGRAEGWLLLAYERAERWPDRLETYRVRFDPLASLQRLARERTDALEDAVRRRDPTKLPACPDWMYERCDYRDVCGCGGSARV
ncbi:MAG: hypothetical protein ACREDK_08350 [Thermoplasmata archaeon]